MNIGSVEMLRGKGGLCQVWLRRRTQSIYNLYRVGQRQDRCSDCTGVQILPLVWRGAGRTDLHLHLPDARQTTTPKELNVLRHRHQALGRYRYDGVPTDNANVTRPQIPGG